MYNIHGKRKYPNKYFYWNHIDQFLLVLPDFLSVDGHHGKVIAQDTLHTSFSVPSRFCFWDLYHIGTLLARLFRWKQ